MAGTTSTPSEQKSDSKAQNALPPGMVMGPDGKPCKICTAFRNWQPGTTNFTEPDSQRTRRTTGTSTQASETQKQNSNAKGAGATALATGVAVSASQQQARLDEPPPGCPPDVEQLGRATWTFLHATAAYYPEKPTPTQRANMLMLLRSLPILYPCGWCALDFGKDIEEHPPQVASRTALSQWLCARHNQVNKKLGKETFDCAKVDERWKDGPSDGRCD